MSSAISSLHHHNHFSPNLPPAEKWDAATHHECLITNGLPSPRSLPSSSPQPPSHLQTLQHQRYHHPTSNQPLASGLAIYSHEPLRTVMPAHAKRAPARTTKASLVQLEDVDYYPRIGRTARRASIRRGSTNASDDDEFHVEASRLRQKRKRSLSPTSSDSDELESLSDADIASGEDRVPCRDAPPAREDDNGQVTIQLSVKEMNIHIPRNHTGPVLVQLDASAAFRLASRGTPPAQLPSAKRPRTSPAVHTYPVHPAKSVPSGRAGFLDLPAELRNEIYRLVFTSGGRFNFACPKGFGRSAALLRTCRQVHDEGRTILYSENDFYFARRTARYGSFWEEEWREVGFRSIRKFVKSIGPKNTSLIRFIGFQFDDATPCLNPDSMTHDERRFVNDDYLMSILRHLGDHAALKRIDLNFHGRRRVENSDARFLSYLRRIKADLVRFVPYPVGLQTAFAMESKQEEVVRVMLLRSMTRSQKLYT